MASAVQPMAAHALFARRLELLLSQHVDLGAGALAGQLVLDKYGLRKLAGVAGASKFSLDSAFGERPHGWTLDELPELLDFVEAPKLSERIWLAIRQRILAHVAARQRTRRYIINITFVVYFSENPDDHFRHASKLHNIHHIQTYLNYSHHAMVQT